MQWKIETPPSLTREQYTSCILHSVQALMGVVAYDLSLLAEDLRDTDEVGKALPLARAALRRMRRDPSITEVANDCEAVLTHIQSDMIRYERELACCHRHRHAIGHTANSLCQIAQYLDMRLVELRETNGDLDKWRRYEVSEVRDHIKSFLKSMAAQSEGRYAFTFTNGSQPHMYKVDIQILSELDGSLTLPCMMLDVVRDIVANARKYSLPGSTIQISIAAEPDAVWFRVADQGRGILETDLPHVAQYGYRGVNTLAKETAVGGLGLTKAHVLATACGGSLSINSTVDEGTTVELLFPKRVLATTPAE